MLNVSVQLHLQLHFGHSGKQHPCILLHNLTSHPLAHSSETLLPLNMNFLFPSFFQKKNLFQSSQPSASSAWFATFRNFLLLCPENVMFKKWPALMDAGTCKKILPRGLYFPEQPEVCPPPVQSWHSILKLKKGEYWTLLFFVLTLFCSPYCNAVGYGRESLFSQYRNTYIRLHRQFPLLQEKVIATVLKSNAKMLCHALALESLKYTK